MSSLIAQTNQDDRLVAAERVRITARSRRAGVASVSEMARSLHTDARRAGESRRAGEIRRVGEALHVAELRRAGGVRRLGEVRRVPARPGRFTPSSLEAPRA
jgi:hypothetical protein